MKDRKSASPRDRRRAPQIRIGNLGERDIDLVLLELFAASREFSRWILSRIPNWPTQFDRLAAAARSDLSSTGESDLLLWWESAAGAKAVLLIENKISASFQPDQLQRYRDRAELMLASEGCSNCSLLLVAPAAYRKSPPPVVDGLVTYEDILDWLGSQKNPDLLLKEAIFKSAITKAKLGYDPISNASVTNFWLAYWEFARTNAPELFMRKPVGKPAKAGFVSFSGDGLDGTVLIHKLRQGCADLQISGWGNRIPQLRKTVSAVLETDMTVERAAGSGSVRIVVPKLATGSPFAGQEEQVRTGLQACRRLLRWAGKNRAILARLSSK